MNIIVTGGAGFLGKHLCRALAKQGHVVRVIDVTPNPEFPTELIDIRDVAQLQPLFAGVDAVFHLAAKIEAGESVKQPELYFEHNVLGTLQVLEAMKTHAVPYFLFSSSAAVYGEPLHVPISEDDRTLPINPYGVTKLSMEGLVNSYVATSSLTGVGLRYFNLYGPEEHHQPETHAIPRFIDQIYHDKPVTVWGSGEHKRDYIYIADIVSAHLLALAYAQQHTGKYHYYNISAEQPCSVAEVITLIADTLGKQAQIEHFPERPGDPLLLYANAAKAREQLGWNATVTLPEGIRRTVEYFLQQWQSQDTHAQ